MDREKEIMKASLQLIADLGFDYDGCNTIQSLKTLVDELVDIAKNGLKGESPKYYGGDGYIRNIFDEIIGKYD